MSETPETDHAALLPKDGANWSDVVLVEFARKLERERDMLKKHISIMDISHKIANDEYFKLAVENEKLERERDELRKALSLAGKFCHEVHHPKSMQHGDLDSCPVEALIQQALYKKP